jgi:hypothetical protein
LAFKPTFIALACAALLHLLPLLIVVEKALQFGAALPIILGGSPAIRILVFSSGYLALDLLGFMQYKFYASSLAYYL